MRDKLIKATLICGTLDILYAIVMTLLNNGSPQGMLMSVASGPFGAGAKTWGILGAGVGLAVHYTIMTAMVGTYLYIRKKFTKLNSMNPYLLGAAYGTILYLVMYWIVLSLRWPAVFPQSAPISIVKSLFPHIFLVGIPLALIARGIWFSNKSTA